MKIGRESIKKKKKKLFIFLFPRCSNYYFIIFHENKKGTYILVWYVIKIRIVRYTVQYNTNNIIIWKPLYPKIFLNQIQRVKGTRKGRSEMKKYFSPLCCLEWNEGLSRRSDERFLNFKSRDRKFRPYFIVIFHITLTRWTVRISLKSQTMQAFCTLMNSAYTPNSIPFHPFPRIITRFALSSVRISLFFKIFSPDGWIRTNPYG